jgi:hypothetical protein
MHTLYGIPTRNDNYPSDINPNAVDGRRRSSVALDDPTEDQLQRARTRIDRKFFTLEPIADDLTDLYDGLSGMSYREAYDALREMKLHLDEYRERGGVL